MYICPDRHKNKEGSFMSKYFLVPRKGLRVIDDKTKKPLPPEGKEVAQSQYWDRLLKCRDVEIKTFKKREAKN
jgi:hypothetical protein